jgi:hypothetical protein
VRWDRFDADGIGTEGLRVPEIPAMTTNPATDVLCRTLKIMRVTLHQLAPYSYFGQWLGESPGDSNDISGANAQPAPRPKTVIHSRLAAS